VQRGGQRTWAALLSSSMIMLSRRPGCGRRRADAGPDGPRGARLASAERSWSRARPNHRKARRY